jgi:type I restriction enzyme S subunit
MLVRLCNYTDVYNNDVITQGMGFMTASATPEQVGRFRLRRGDTIITKDSETADDIGVPAFVDYEADDLICGYHLAIVRPSSRMDARYLYWVMASQPTHSQWAVLASGVTRVGIRSSDLRKLSIPLPPLAVQRAIADYLDRETARIDELIAEQERFVEMLEERRRAVIYSAATGGLHPSGPTVPSGLQWIGDLTTAWGIAPLRRCAALLTGSTPPTAEPDNYSETPSDHPWVRPQDLSSDTSASAWLTKKGWETLRPVPAGSVLVGCIAYSLGSVGYATVEVTTNQQITSLIPRGHGRFLYYLMIAAKDELWASSQINRVPILNNERLGAIRVPVPPLDEQRNIAVYLDKQTARIDNLITEAEHLINLARERRSALITAAVTGQIDVGSGS